MKVGFEPRQPDSKLRRRFLCAHREGGKGRGLGEAASSSGSCPSLLAFQLCRGRPRPEVFRGRHPLPVAIPRGPGHALAQEQAVLALSPDYEGVSKICRSSGSWACRPSRAVVPCFPGWPLPPCVSWLAPGAAAAAGQRQPQLCQAWRWWPPIRESWLSWHEPGPGCAGRP